MIRPGVLVGEQALFMSGQSADQRPSQVVLAHVLQSRVVDHIVGVAGSQQAEEVLPALAARGAEPGEVVIANLRADRVGAAVARAGVVHRDPRRGLQPGTQNLLGLGQKPILLVNQQTHDLALRDADAERLQHGDQPLHRHLSLVVLHQHEATQFRAEMATHAAGQRSHDHLACRRQPTLATVMDRAGGDHQVLHIVRLVAPELRARRMGRPQHLGLDLDPRRHLATATPFAARAGAAWVSVLLHPARLDRRAAFQALQPGNLVALRGEHRLQLRQLAKQFDKARFKLST